jgi:hypothetical protein
MEVNFADSFGDSLKTLIRHQTWWYKTYSLFRYDLPRFFKNIWKFRKALWNHYWWDHHAILQFVEIGFDHMAVNIEERGNEVDESRLKKVRAMKRAVELIRNYNEDLYIDMAESELGEIIHRDWEFEDVEDRPGFSRIKDTQTQEQKDHNSKVYARSRKIQEDEWNELCYLIKGQDHSEYRKMYDSLTDEEKNKEDHYYKWFDGSGLKGWWD